MKIVLFCENKYAIDILYPLYQEAEDEGVNDILWYVHEKRIPDFPLKDKVKWTNSMQKVYDFFPEAVYVPGNIVPIICRALRFKYFMAMQQRRKTIG